MTVAAVVLPKDDQEALADVAGRVAIRRIVDAAWAGGALPIIVVVTDGDGSISTALEGSPAVLIDPQGAAGLEPAWIGVAAALEAVRETSAALLWPGRMAWIDPETVTSLIEAHGHGGDLPTRPRRAGQAGWPILLPAAQALATLASGAGTLEEFASDLAAATLELGDPGSVLDLETSLDDLPDYAGPPEPVGGPPPEWGAAAAEIPEPEVPGPDDPPPASSA